MVASILLLIAGLVGGILAGITGVGTGFIMIVVIPIALDALGLPETSIVPLTIANTIFATMCSALINNVQLLMKRKIYAKETLITALTAGLTAAALLLIVVYNNAYTATIYNAIIVLLMVYIIIRTLGKLRKRLVQNERITPLKLAATGITGGSVAALTGLGGGSMVIPMLNLWMKVGIKKAKTISYGTIFITSFILSCLNLTHDHGVDFLGIPHMGYIVFPVAVPLALGVILGSPIGLRIGERLSSRTISYIFLSIISIVTLRKLIDLVLSINI